VSFRRRRLPSLKSGMNDLPKTQHIVGSAG